MRSQHLLIAGAITLLAINFTACEKNDTPETSAAEITTTTDLAARQAITDNIAEDNNAVFMEASVSGGLTGNRPVAGARPLTPDILGGGTVTISASAGFPKTITIDFGAGATFNGITRKGIINIVVSDSVRKTGSTAIMSFNNYYVNGYKIEGTYTWTNTSTVSTKSWKREVVDGKITNDNGIFWRHSGVRFITQINGETTPFILADDVFSVTGNHSITNMLGRTRTVTVITPLIKANAYRFITQGSIKIQGPTHYVTIDYGAGALDNQATISLDGGIATPFTMN